MNRLRALMAGLILPVLCAACVMQPVPHSAASLATIDVADQEVDARYIVQARDVAKAAEAVESVGGRVTHELAIIRAVGAELTTTQAALLREHVDIISVFEDGIVKTASTSCAVSTGLTTFENNKFSWTITNNGTSTTTIGAITLGWPTTNGKLKKIKFDNDDIWTAGTAAPFAQIVSGWHDDVRRRQLAPGQSAALKFEFDSNIDWNEANYSIFVDFEEGCSVEFTPRVMDCRSNGLAYRKFSGNKIEWGLPNDGTDAITLDQVSVNWPEENGDLKKIKVGAAVIYDVLRPAPVATVADGWHPDIKIRRIMPGSVETLTLEFANDISVDEESYSIIAEFSENCRADFAPSIPLVGDGQKVDKKARETHFVRHVGADQLHEAGITGNGVTVAVLDTGLWSSGGGKNWLRKDYNGDERILRDSRRRGRRDRGRGQERSRQPRHEHHPVVAQGEWIRQ